MSIVIAPAFVTKYPAFFVSITNVVEVPPASQLSNDIEVPDGVRGAVVFVAATVAGTGMSVRPKVVGPTAFGDASLQTGSLWEAAVGDALVATGAQAYALGAAMTASGGWKSDAPDFKFPRQFRFGIIGAGTGASTYVLGFQWLV